MSPNVSMSVDIQNVRLNRHQATILIDLAKSKGTLREKKIYFNSECKCQTQIPKKFKGLGFKFEDVPSSLKNSADDRLKANLLDGLEYPPNVVILVSGDGDFTPSVRALQKQGIKVIVVATRGNVKQDLKAIADEFHFIDDLKLPANSTT
ncbi:hypothetical protein TUMEXPCC7403_07775 [Tumidithrix helvetica PCC 7403]|uniref:NYN domain-containing protein n=1 Tax=Tumidithrix helvetica TaxID=3457545 RepID=UPI003CBE6B18